MPYKILVVRPLDSTDGKWNDYSTHKTLTCKNHTDIRLSTKNPWTRSLFVMTGPECACPFSDVVEIVEDVQSW